MTVNTLAGDEPLARDFLRHGGSRSKPNAVAGLQSDGQKNTQHAVRQRNGIRGRERGQYGPEDV